MLTMQRSRMEERRAILDIQRAISMHLESEGLFTAIADVVRRVMPFDYMAIVLPDLKNNTFLVYLIEAQKERLRCYPSTIFPYAGTVPAWVLKHKRSSIAYMLDDLQPFPGFFDGCAKAGLQSHCTLPLMIRDRVAGVLTLAAKNPDQYNVLDLPFLEETAGIIAGALDNRFMDGETFILNEPPVAEKACLQEETKSVHVFKEIIGKSQTIQKVLNR